MDRQHALKILGIEETSDKRIIKKKYRALMHRVHPDSMADGHGTDYEFSAHEINAAYEYLLNSAPDEQKPEGEDKNSWNAPVNENAFAGRDIYQYAEGAEGSRHGIFCAARGKYIKIPDEEHKLFLLSIFNLSRSLLDGFGDSVASKYQAELAYLLLQQFTDPEKELERYLIVEEKEERIYYIPSMLETEGKRNRINEGDSLYPAGVRKHRLYVKTRAGTEAGYISFSDDMLYQTVVPMFESRSVQVKIRAGGSTFGNNSIRKIKVRNVDLWLKAVSQDRREVTLSISEKIRELLKKAAGH